jgi:hypothetical protein
MGKEIVTAGFLTIKLFIIPRYTPSVKKNCCEIMSRLELSNKATFLRNSFRDSASS